MGNFPAPVKTWEDHAANVPGSTRVGKLIPLNLPLKGACKIGGAQYGETCQTEWLPTQIVVKDTRTQNCC